MTSTVTFVDGGLNSETQYWYYLTSVDTVGNESSSSGTFSEVTLENAQVDPVTWWQDFDPVLLGVSSGDQMPRGANEIGHGTGVDP